MQVQSSKVVDIFDAENSNLQHKRKVINQKSIYLFWSHMNFSLYFDICKRILEIWRN